MVKDRLGNVLGNGQKVLIALPESQIFGFIAEIRENNVIRGIGGKATEPPGMVLVSCVIALPVDWQTGQSAQCVRVYDPDKHEPLTPPVPQPN